MLSDSMVSIFFRLINFGLFIALFIYGFKRYVYPALLEQMAEREKAHKELEQKKELLADTQFRLDEQMHTNERVHQELVAALNTWRLTFEREQQAQHKEKERIKHELEIKMHKRREVQALNALHDEVVTPAVNQAEKALRTYFTGKEHSRAYLHQLLSRMESKS